MSLALQSESFENEDLADQLTIFLVAGQEIIAKTLAWAIHQPCKHFDVRERLHLEIRGTLPSLQVDDIMRVGRLDRLKYSQAVCNEDSRSTRTVPMAHRPSSRGHEYYWLRNTQGHLSNMMPWLNNRSQQA